MSYRIDYCVADSCKKTLKSGNVRRSVAVATSILFLVAGALAVKHTGLAWVKRFLIPGDPAVTAAALENLVEDLRDGDPLSEAITAFCQEIVENAE